MKKSLTLSKNKNTASSLISNVVYAPNFLKVSSNSQSLSHKSSSMSGFTLIELLVVIAIIGILSSVILASLNTARSKGSDSAVKSGLANMRAQAEMFYYDRGINYSGVCLDTNVGIATMLAKATSTGGGPSIAPAIACADSATSWSAGSYLKGGGAWCVGSSGASKATTTTVLGTANWVSDSCK